MILNDTASREDEENIIHEGKLKPPKSAKQLAEDPTRNIDDEVIVKIIVLGYHI